MESNAPPILATTKTVNVSTPESSVTNAQLPRLLAKKISIALLGESNKIFLANVPLQFVMLSLEFALLTQPLALPASHVINANKLVLQEMLAMESPRLALEMLPETFCAIAQLLLVMMDPSAPRILATLTPELANIPSSRATLVLKLANPIMTASNGLLLPILTSNARLLVAIR